MLSTHEEYAKLINERYSAKKSESYEARGLFDCVLFGAEQYLVEASMLTYAKKHPDATLQEMYDYFDKIAPEGLAPGDDGADLLED